jgi:two-component system, OmpR family, sensor histidine kinase CpxA
MRARIPLSAKFALWLLLNLALLAVGAAIFFRAQFSHGFSSFLAGTAATRVEAFAYNIATLLRENGRGEWDRKLHAFSTARGVPVAVFENNGQWLAGPKFELPREVVNELEKPSQPPRPAGERDDGPPGPRPGDSRRQPPRPDRPGSRNPPPQRPPILREDEPTLWPKFLVRTTDPTAYWIGIRAPIDVGREHRPSTLLIRSESLAQGGLLLEPRPIILAAAVAGVASILFWLPFVHGLTRALRRVTAATGEVARGNFAVRVTEQRRDELGELADSVNTMAGQLDALVTGQRRFLGDIAHELCSPIARLQAALAILEQRVADAKQAGYVASALEELDDMSRLVSELLEFSKASIQRDIALQAVALAPLVAETIAREASGVDVTCDVPSGLSAQAEPKLLARALGNVLRNAVRYAGGAGPIVISAAPYGGKIALVVADSGPGVPADSIPRLFDAFYRPDSARTRETGGTGLGLAIVKSCIEACGGVVMARNGGERGLEVLFSLQAVA